MLLPKAFEDDTRQLMGDARYQRYLDGLALPPSTSIRLNPFKVKDAIDGAVNEVVPDGNTTPVPWCRLGHYLPTRPTFTSDPLLHAGLYYVQESSSMFVCEAVRQRQ